MTRRLALGRLCLPVPRVHRAARLVAIVLLFILLYKFGDAVLGVMKVPFFLETGFSKTEIAEIAKLFGFVATVIGGLIGGVVVARLGIMRGLMVCGVAMALSNLVFVLQAWVGPDLGVLALTVSVENITTGMGMTAFVAYMSSLCNVAYTATQYALAHFADGDGTDGALIGLRLARRAGELADFLRADDDRRGAGSAAAVAPDAAVSGDGQRTRLIRRHGA